MAQPTNSFDSYDSVGIREDLSDIITNVDPEETPLYTRLGKVKAKNVLHEWQTDSLRASSTSNAHIEGDDTVADAASATTRLGNYCQIFKNAVVIPDTDEALDKAGRGKEIAYQVMKIAKEQRLDIEATLFNNQARDAGSSSTPRKLAGLPSWLTTNTVNETGNSGADPTGDGTDARTDDGTPVAFSQTRFDTAMQSIWESGGRPDVVMLSAFQMDIALDFTGNNNQRSTISASRTRNTVINDVDVYVTPWGTVEFVPCRENRSRDVFILQSDKWKVANLRPMRNTPLAKTGDNTKRQILCELTLVSLNEKASGAVYDNSTS